MENSPAFSVSESTRRHLIRVGETVVLEVLVLFPALSLYEGENSTKSAQISRFNKAYSAAADAFLSWCRQELAEHAKTAFAAAGAGAVYTFDRRVATFCATVEEEPGVLTVRRRVTLGSRRGGVLSSREQVDRWRTTDLTVIFSRRRVSVEKS